MKDCVESQQISISCTALSRTLLRAVMMRDDKNYTCNGALKPPETANSRNYQGKPLQNRVRNMNSPFCLPYLSSNVGSENLVKHQVNTPLVDEHRYSYHLSSTPIRLTVIVCSANFKLMCNRPYSYSRYWTRTSSQWRPLRGNIIKKRLMSFAFEKIPHISLSRKLVPVQYREYEYGLFTSRMPGVINR